MRLTNPVDEDEAKVAVDDGEHVEEAGCDEDEEKGDGNAGEDEVE